MEAMPGELAGGPSQLDSVCTSSQGPCRSHAHRQHTVSRACRKDLHSRRHTCRIGWAVRCESKYPVCKQSPQLSGCAAVWLHMS